MCEPISATTLAAISIASTVASIGMSIYGQIQQSTAQQAQYGYQAAVMRNNASIAEMQANDATERGKVAEARQRQRTAQIMGTQLAGLAGQGTEISGSASDILGDTAAAGEFDALTIRGNAAREAWGYRARGAEYSAQANAPGPAGLSGLSVGASLLAGGGQVADKWYRYGLNTGGGMGGYGSAAYTAAASPGMLSGGQM